MSIRTAVALLVLSSLYAVTPPAKALEYQTLAAGACKSALPVYDGNIRSRPLAVQNEGWSLAFVTCTQQNDTAVRASNASIALVNTTGGAVTVNCTLVEDTLPATYTARSVTIAAGAKSGIVFLPEADTEFYFRFAFSCGIPPGVGIVGVAAAHP